MYQQSQKVIYTLIIFVKATPITMMIISICKLFVVKFVVAYVGEIYNRIIFWVQ